MELFVFVCVYFFRNSFSKWINGQFDLVTFRFSHMLILPPSIWSTDLGVHCRPLGHPDIKTWCLLENLSCADSVFIIIMYKRSYNIILSQIAYMWTKPCELNIILLNPVNNQKAHLQKIIVNLFCLIIYFILCLISLFDKPLNKFPVCVAQSQGIALALYRSLSAHIS